MNEKQNRLSDKVNAAFQAAAAAAIERAKQTGTPVIVWEDGQIKEIPSAQFEQVTQQPNIEKSAS